MSARAIDIFAAALTARPAQSNDPNMTSRLIIAVLLAAAALPALADDVPLPDLTPKSQYLVMTQDDATSTSKCIGDPKTPMCAVETRLACFLRSRPDLCQIAMGLDHDPGFGRYGHDPGTLYRIVRRESLTDRRFPWRPTHNLPSRAGEISLRAGDIRIDVVEIYCFGEVSTAGCERSGPTITYIIRRQVNRWAVIDWGLAYDPRH
jgi:hypothetical protein